MRKGWAILMALAALVMPLTALASIGVGVGTGKIDISEPLKSGGIYTLPSVTVFNTGTEEANYEMAVTLNEHQSEFKPNPAWFSFSPSSFTLKPQQSQAVTPTLHLPLRIQPGNYFAYLEAHPVQTVLQGSTTVGVAAATKLSFSVKSANLLLAAGYRLLDLYRQYEPWSRAALTAVIVLIVLLILNRFINLRAAVKAAWSAGRTRRQK